MTPLTQFHIETDRDFSKLTLEEIQSWTVITERTPGGGICYYNKKPNLCAVVYPKKVKLFYNTDESSKTLKHPREFDHMNLFSR